MYGLPLPADIFADVVCVSCGAIVPFSGPHEARVHICMTSNPDDMGAPLWAPFAHEIFEKEGDHSNFITCCRDNLHDE